MQGNHISEPDSANEKTAGPNASTAPVNLVRIANILSGFAASIGAVLITTTHWLLGELWMTIIAMWYLLCRTAKWLSSEGRLWLGRRREWIQKCRFGMELFAAGLGDTAIQRELREFNNAKWSLFHRLLNEHRRRILLTKLADAHMMDSNINGSDHCELIALVKSVDSCLKVANYHRREAWPKAYAERIRILAGLLITTASVVGVLFIMRSVSDDYHDKSKARISFDSLGKDVAFENQATQASHIGDRQMKSGSRQDPARLEIPPIPKIREAEATDLARKLLEMAINDVALVDKRYRAETQWNLATSLARLGETNAAKLVGLAPNNDPLLDAILVQGHIEEALTKARLIANDSAAKRADAFIAIGDLLESKGLDKDAAKALRSAFFDVNGRRLEPTTRSIVPAWYNEQVERVNNKLISLLIKNDDLDSISRWGLLNGDDMVRISLQNKRLDIAISEALSFSGLKDIGLAVDLMSKLSELNRVSEASKVCRKVAHGTQLNIEEHWSGYLGKEDGEYGADATLIPLAAAAATYIGVEAAREVAEVHRDDSMRVDALVSAAVARHRVKDQNGCDTLMREARAAAVQCTRYVDRLDAGRYVIRGMVQIGDIRAAEHYANACKVEDQVLGAKIGSVIESTKAQVARESIAKQLTGKDNPSGIELAKRIEYVSNDHELNNAFKLAQMIGPTDGASKIRAYRHLYRIKPDASQWKEIRAQWSSAARSASLENADDGLARIMRMSDVCELQVGVLGLADSDVKVTLERMLRTKLPRFAIDDGTLYELDPAINKAFSDSAFTSVLSQAIAFELYHDRYKHAEAIWGSLPYSTGRDTQGELIVRAYIHAGDLESAERFCARIRQAEKVTIEVAKSWLLVGNSTRAIRLAASVKSSGSVEVLGQAVACVAAKESIRSAQGIVQQMENPHQRIKILITAAEHLRQHHIKK